MGSYYITTPIYYVNDVPHIGHAYTTVACDVAARYHRLLGDQVYFLTGTDEHGQKIERAAHDQGLTPQQLADRVVERFRELWERLNVSNDDFIRTTEPRHREGVHKLFRQLRDKGDIYLGEYEGWYCTPCETFWTDTQVGDDEDQICPDCSRQIERVKEQSYFFRMSKYAEPLLEHIRAHPEFIEPQGRRNEILRFVEGGLRDLSISRTSFDWGIKVPDDPEHVIYVWFDALTNYMTALGYGSEDDSLYRQFWPASAHVVGKDILRFHTVYWPTFLLAAGLPLPERVFAHGWWTIEGQKMSKSLRNVVDPHVLVERFGVDQIRYFLLREVPFGLDGDFSMQALVGRINSDLANDLGNLLNRLSGMMFKYCEGRVPGPGDPTGFEQDLQTLIEREVQHFHEHMRNLAFNRALMALWEIVSALNKYIVATEPWSLHKQQQHSRLNTALLSVAEGLRIVANGIAPFMPDSAERIARAMGVKLDGEFGFGASAASAQMQRMPVLFERVEMPERSAADEAADAERDEAEQDQLIDFATFQQISIKAGRILEAERVPKSSKLLKLRVDLGEAAPRTIVSGIAKSYSPEDLVDRMVPVIANLKPAKLMGIESNGMILAATASGRHFRIPFVADDVSAGTDIK